MTCKDCVHYELCVQEKETVEMLAYQTKNDVEQICIFFKDKTRFVELPCKVGDKIYAIRKNCNIFYIKQFEVFEIAIDVSVVLKTITWSIPKYKLSHKEETWFLIDDIGKTVFLTPKEAEEKLKEMKYSENVEYRQISSHSGK